MLFHVTARHTFDQCGMYNEEVQNALKAFFPSIQQLCQEHSVKLHYAVTGHPVDKQRHGIISVFTVVPSG